MMKKILFLAIIFLTNACVPSFDRLNCPIAPSYADQDFAQSAYDDLGTSLANVKFEEIKKMFGCFYEAGDKVYYYSRFMNSGYVLVRSGKAITYYDEK